MPQAKKTQKNNQNQALKPRKDINKRKSVECFVCEKMGHYAKKCRHRKGNKAKSQANLTKDDFEAKMKAVILVSFCRDWWVDTCAT